MEEGREEFAAGLKEGKKHQIPSLPGCPSFSPPNSIGAIWGWAHLSKDLMCGCKVMLSCLLENKIIGLWGG